MTVTAKDLRFNISMLFDMLNKGEDITITYRGKPKAKLSPFDSVTDDDKSSEMFGLLKDSQDSVDDAVRSMRRGRNFDI